MPPVTWQQTTPGAASHACRVPPPHRDGRVAQLHVVNGMLVDLAVAVAARAEAGVGGGRGEAKEGRRGSGDQLAGKLATLYDASMEQAGNARQPN